MSRTEALLTLALDLPEDERALLATAIQASLPQPEAHELPTPAQLAELQRRVEAMDNGTAEYVSADVMEADFRAALERSRNKHYQPVDASGLAV